MLFLISIAGLMSKLKTQRSKLKTFAMPAATAVISTPTVTDFTLLRRNLSTSPKKSAKKIAKKIF